MRLSEIEQGAQIEVPRECGEAIKAMSKGAASEGQQMLALRFIVEALAGTDRMSFVPGVNEAALVSAWKEGRRFVGLKLREIIATPIGKRAEPAAPFVNRGPQGKRKTG
jgi:hypothetical protein